MDGVTAGGGKLVWKVKSSPPSTEEDRTGKRELPSGDTLEKLSPPSTKEGRTNRRGLTSGATWAWNVKSSPSPRGEGQTVRREQPSGTTSVWKVKSSPWSREEGEIIRRELPSGATLAQKVKSSPRSKEEGKTIRKELPSGATSLQKEEGQAIRRKLSSGATLDLKIKSSPPSREGGQTIRGELANGATSAYFRTFDCRTYNRINWYKFNLGEDGEDRVPKCLTPFSKVEQYGNSTIIGFRSFIYCLGGSDTTPSKPSNCVYRYNTANPNPDPNKPWEKVRNMGHGRVNAQAFVANGKIYVMGGLNTYVDSYSDKKTLVKFWAEFYDPQTDKWTPLTVHYDGEDEKISPYLILCPGASPNFVYKAALVGPYQILLANQNGVAYLFDARDHYLKRLQQKLFIDSSCDSFTSGYAQYLIDENSKGALVRLGMDKSKLLESKQPFYVGYEHTGSETTGNYKLLREDSLPRASDYAKQFHVIWFSPGGTREYNTIVFYRNFELVEDTDSKEVTHGCSDLSIKSTKYYYIPAEMELLDGLLLEHRKWWKRWE